jgi:hypothetical protein
MRLFKANQPVQSEEDRARDLRLTAIASRYRVRDPRDQVSEASDPLEIRDVLQ